MTKNLSDYLENTFFVLPLLFLIIVVDEIQIYFTTYFLPFTI
jgi:hypothetical protein